MCDIDFVRSKFSKLYYSTLSGFGGEKLIAKKEIKVAPYNIERLSLSSGLICRNVFSMKLSRGKEDKQYDGKIKKLMGY